MSVRTSPCSWPVSYAACSSSLPVGWEAAEGEEEHADRARFEQMAVDFLWRWTGRVLGVCEVTLRPCRIDTSSNTYFEGRGPYSGGHTAPWRPVLVGGQWYNIGCGACGFDGCGCDGARSVILPGPIESVVQVIVDGAVLEPTAYRLDGSRLVRTDGGTWPVAQNTALPDTAAGTWSVTYLRGVAVPDGGEIAAGILAVELFKAACNDGSCGLPKRFSSITRQGVTVAMLDSFDDIDKGHTGIYLIDSWVASMTQPPARSSVYSPDVRRRVNLSDQH